MFTSVLILTVSVLLLIYWFRYCCIALLRNQSQELMVVSENNFSFLEIQQRVHTALELDPLHRSLDRDYRIVKYLLEHAAGLGSPSVERRILMLDYKLMQVWYYLTRTAAPAQARKAISERATILACLAQRMGEQAGLRVEA